MFPFKSGHFAPRNRWYVAAWSDEVTRTPMERWIMDEPVAFYRREDGTPVALDGRCPHHLYPLGKGRIKGDNIVCGYHGLEFRPDGTAASAPFVEKVPSACRIKSYPVHETWQWIWIWPGDPALADISLIPDHHAAGLTDPRYTTFGNKRYDVAARYQLINDNLLDLQHVELLHDDNIGVAGVGKLEERRESGDDWISSFRTLEKGRVPGPWQPVIGDHIVDRTFGLRFDLPGFHSGYDSYSIPADEEDGGREIGRVNIFHAITPARKHSCHYFLVGGRNFDIANEEVTRVMVEQMPQVVLQDIAAAEDIEGMIMANGERYEEMLFKSDATLVLGRRLMEKMMDAEFGDAK